MTGTSYGAVQVMVLGARQLLHPNVYKDLRDLSLWTGGNQGHSHYPKSGRRPRLCQQIPLLPRSPFAPPIHSLLQYATLRGFHALPTSPLPSTSRAIRGHVQRWAIPQAGAGLLFGLGVSRSPSVRTLNVVGYQLCGAHPY